MTTSINYQQLKSPHLIIIGGGFAGIELVKQLSGKPIKVTLIDKNNYHTFQPLLYQVASGGLGPDAIAYPLRKLIGRIPNIAFRMAKVEEIQLENQLVRTDIGDFSYDYLCIASGSATNFFGNKELQENSMELKSIPQALDLRSKILQEFEKAVSGTESGKLERILNFVVVGGGPTGVETAGALAEIRKHVLPSDYTELDKTLMQVHLVEASERVLAAMSENSSQKAKEFLEQLGVKVHLKTAVQSYDGQLLKLSDGRTMETNTLIWAAGVKGEVPAGIEASNLGRGNRILVNGFNQINGYENAFAVGDVAFMSADEKYPNGHPMVAPVAVQQASLFAKNLQRKLAGQDLVAFRYFDKGSMATVGRHKAVLESFGIKMQGYLAWLGWMFLHLMLLVGYRNRLVVFVNWLWNYLSYQRAIRLITRPYTGKQSKGK
ncbi:MAG: NAD(P)/FAD-dependent oxidoreductase [Bacteroidia bacterium]|nr:NAD(P)/FAD-dependent oxidoreductase [Bacteroidia bacterium]